MSEDSYVFIDRAVRGDFSDLDVAFDEHVEAWHANSSVLPLHEWLGLSWEEYRLVAETPDGLQAVVVARVNERAVSQQIPPL